MRLASGETIEARKGVICSMTPDQLYGRLLRDWPPAARRGRRARCKRYRYGKGNMQIHYALEAPPRWKGGADLGKVALLHRHAGPRRRVARGQRMPNAACCRRSRRSASASRPRSIRRARREGKAILWLQLPEAPRFIKGDAAGEIATPADGRWTEAVREAFADRVERARLAHIEDFAES